MHAAAQHFKDFFCSAAKTSKIRRIAGGL